MTNKELSQKCHEAIDTLATVMEKLVSFEDGGLEVEVLKCFPPSIVLLNYLQERLKDEN